MVLDEETHEVWRNGTPLKLTATEFNLLRYFMLKFTKQSVIAFDFKEALAFANRVGEVAEAEGHHPELHVRWGAVRVVVWTYAVDGLTETDFALARHIDRICAGD